MKGCKMGKMYRRVSQMLIQPAIHINNSVIEKAIKDMNRGKALCPSGITTEMLKISGEVLHGLVTHIH